MESKKTSLLNFFITMTIIFGLLFILVYINSAETKPSPLVDENKGGFEAAIINYKDEVDKYAKEFDLPSSYLMALIILECSGKRKIKPRFEKKIYQQLKLLKKRKILKFENLSPETVKDATDQALRNMASSWGPFQLMGYKCTFLNIKLREMRGDNAIYWGIRWINITYGKYLRKGLYKDAFHLHNTGKKYPEDGISKTFDPDYVEKGLQYMKYFEKIDSVTNKKNSLQ